MGRRVVAATAPVIVAAGRAGEGQVRPTAVGPGRRRRHSACRSRRRRAGRSRATRPGPDGGSAGRVAAVPAARTAGAGGWQRGRPPGRAAVALRRAVARACGALVVGAVAVSMLLAPQAPAAPRSGRGVGARAAAEGLAVRRAGRGDEAGRPRSCRRAKRLSAVGASGWTLGGPRRASGRPAPAADPGGVLRWLLRPAGGRPGVPLHYSGALRITPSPRLADLPLRRAARESRPLIGRVVRRLVEAGMRGSRRARGPASSGRARSRACGRAPRQALRAALAADPARVLDEQRLGEQPAAQLVDGRAGAAAGRRVGAGGGAPEPGGAVAAVAAGRRRAFAGAVRAAARREPGDRRVWPARLERLAATAGGGDAVGDPDRGGGAGAVGGDAAAAGGRGPVAAAAWMWAALTHARLLRRLPAELRGVGPARAIAALSTRAVAPSRNSSSSRRSGNGSPQLPRPRRPQRPGTPAGR